MIDLILILLTASDVYVKPANGAIPTAIWVNEGGDKVRQEELRASYNFNVRNSVWNGNMVSIAGARDEVISLNVVLEAATISSENLEVSLTDLIHSSKGSAIRNRNVDGNGVFNWIDRDIELFFVRYLEIKGLSLVSYDTYDERHIPEPLQRKGQTNGQATGGWRDRSAANQHFPEIAVPIELQKTFSIQAGKNQSIWIDIHIPRSTESGVYSGAIVVKQSGSTIRLIPVELKVFSFALPEIPTSKTMVYLGYQDINTRYLGKRQLRLNTPDYGRSKLIRDRHFQIAHRHRISLVDLNLGDLQPHSDRPGLEWIPRLSGELFSARHDYAGPWANAGNGVFSIGTYSSWSWKADESESSMWKHTDNWARWFQRNFPLVDTFLYLIDESSHFKQIERWSKWIKNNPGPGHQIKSFATLALPDAIAHTPSLDIAVSTLAVGPNQLWDKARTSFLEKGGEFYMYNGKRPASGSFATEDDGTALRQIPWGQLKKSVSRWFYWESTYYDDYQSGQGHSDLFSSARTLGSVSRNDESLGETGHMYSNGDGVLFYPGTDTLYPQQSYGLNGPIASLRLKHWRRGIQDADYLALAMKKDPEKTWAIIHNQVPKVLWENDVDDINDPTTSKSPISWQRDPDQWEKARLQLAEIIEGK